MTWKYLRQYLSDNNISYADYLKTPHWQDVRKRFWASKLHDHSCYSCKAKNKPLEVHHKSYKRVGDERLHDLCLLCRDCHGTIHQLEKENEGKRWALWSSARRFRKSLGISMRNYRHK